MFDRCFAAGTLVNAVSGLVPIEEIKVGDLVLSQPEQGGERSYKRVTKTFTHDFQQVMLLDVGLLEGPRSPHMTNSTGRWLAKERECRAVANTSS